MRGARWPGRLTQHFLVEGHYFSPALRRRLAVLGASIWALWRPLPGFVFDLAAFFTVFAVFAALARELLPLALLFAEREAFLRLLGSFFESPDVDGLTSPPALSATRASSRAQLDVPAT